MMKCDGCHPLAKHNIPTFRVDAKHNIPTFRVDAKHNIPTFTTEATEILA